MTLQAFLDSNVLIDAIVPSDHDHHSRCVRLFESVARGDVVLHLSATVLLEAAFVLTRTLKYERGVVVQAFSYLLQLQGVQCSEKHLLERAVEMWATEAPLSFADCYHILLAEALGLDGIISFDRKMGRYDPVKRLEP